ncbi:unnamed protein product [Didymodactylos carnosus]|uniref:CCHC-type domain-containing protein n=1 Tax=Didymodactylos carnosus TaxID=1234261 RepID=A0A814RY82_9BILA|nr:unnamed protein product [Didymodactylos carnosus]CAF3903214.1 unnamed protein product [Didymodactylos carnosus]CAF4387620.1 unnamed protein product [Didymodactylos carnosus]
MSSSNNNNATAPPVPRTSVIIHGMKLEDVDLPNVQRQIGHRYVGIVNVRFMFNKQKQLISTLLAEFKSFSVVKDILKQGFISIGDYKYRVEDPNSFEKNAQPQKRPSRPVMTCFKCQQPGHKVNQCPEWRNEQCEYVEEQYYSESRNNLLLSDCVKQKFESYSTVDDVWPPLSTVQKSRIPDLVTQPSVAYTSAATVRVSKTDQITTDDDAWPSLSTVQKSRVPEPLTQPPVVHTSTAASRVSKTDQSTPKSMQAMPTDLLKDSGNREVNKLNSLESKLLQMEVKLTEQDQYIRELQQAVNATIIPAFDELKIIINKYNTNYVQMKQELSDAISRTTTVGSLKTFNDFA